MAEIMTVVTIAAHIIELVDLGIRVLNRLGEYQSTLAEIPEAFRHIKAELPVLLDALRQTKAAIDDGASQDDSKDALEPALKECDLQMKVLYEVIEKLLPKRNESRTKKVCEGVAQSLGRGKSGEDHVDHSGFCLDVCLSCRSFIETFRRYDSTIS
jgi:hypothetical protein